MSPDFVGTLKPPRLATAPGSAVVGQSYYDTVLNAVRYWNGTAWVTTDLRYNGDWAAGSYTDGDIVVYNSTSYLCVRPTSSAPAGWTPVYSARTYGTTLPASPVDGQEAVLVDSTTNPSYQWLLRYNNGSSSAYKWELVGGAAASATVATSENGGATVAGDLPTVGPSITLPRNGDYLFTLGAEVSNSVGGNATYVAVTVGTPQAGAEMVNDTAGSAYLRRLSRTIRVNGLTAGVAKLQYYVSAGTGTWQNRDLQATPIRVS